VPVWINYSACSSSYGSIVYYNISVFFGTTLFYSRNNSLNLSYLYTPAMDGTYTTKITCYDNNSLSAFDIGDPFTYDTTGPILVPTAPLNNSVIDTLTNSTTPTFSFNSDGNYNCTFWDNYTNSTPTYAITGVNDLIGLVYPVNASYKWYINCSDDLGNVGFTYPYNFYVNQSYPPTTPSYSGGSSVITEFSSIQQGLFYMFIYALWIFFLMATFTFKSDRNRTIQLFNIFQVFIGIVVGLNFIPFSFIIGFATLFVAVSVFLGKSIYN